MPKKNHSFDRTAFPECRECLERIWQADWEDERYSHVAGCKRLSKKDWDRGFFQDRFGTFHQGGCPLQV